MESGRFAMTNVTVFDSVAGRSPVQWMAVSRMG